MIKIVSVGWQCEPFIEQTLRSVEEQTVQDWEIHITYDASSDTGAQSIIKWCDPRDARWRQYSLNEDQRFAVRNQYEAIKHLAPEDDDIIVFLDLDGDRLAHPGVLQRLLDYYADDTQLTYGSYKPIPFNAGCQPAIPFPFDVIANNSYRSFMAHGGMISFNHLRTMKGRIFKAMSEELFKWPDTDEWYEAGTDYLFMINGLELAGGRHKCLDELMLLYNNANPMADNITHPDVTSASVASILSRPPLDRL